MPIDPAAPLPDPALRVAHLVRPSEGGMRAQVAALLCAFPPALVAAPPDVLAWLAHRVAAADTLALPARSGPGLLPAGVRAGRWARRRGATLLHGHGLRWLPLFAVTARAGGLPLVVTLHNLVAPDLSALERGIMSVCLGRVMRIIAVSHAIARSVEAALPHAAGRVRVVHNGIDPAPLALPHLTRDAARERLGLTGDGPIVLCVARLSREKGVDTLIHAAAQITGAMLLVAGDGPERTRLQAQIDRAGLAGRARLLGQRDDIPALLRAADLLAMPSRAEGLGIAALEAMASGLPVVATRVGGLPEVVADGETGLLVPPDDPAAFAGAINRLLSDPDRAQAMGQAGQNRVAAQFSRAAMVAATHAVYAEALGSRA